MTNLASDNFNRSNSGSWGTASDGSTVWSRVIGTSNFTIVSNKGAVDTNSGPYCVMRAGSGTSNDTEQVVTIVRANTNDVAGLVFRYTSGNDWYFVCIGEFTNNLSFSKLTGGSYISGVAFGPSTSFPTATTYTLKVRNIGTSVKARIWDASGSEPSTWDIDTTDSDHTTGGYGILADPWTSTAQTFDDYTATDGSSGTTYTITANDTSNASDTRTLTDARAQNDSANATDTKSFTSALAYTGTSNATDTRAFTIQTSATDSATGTDTRSFAASISRTENANATEAVTYGIATGYSGASAATDGTTTGSAIARSDLALSTDTRAFSMAVSPVDNAISTETISLILSLSRSDISIATDSYSFNAPSSPVGIAVSFRMRSGAVTFRKRSGAITFHTRTGAISMRSRK